MNFGIDHKSLALLVMTLGFASCASQNSLVQDPPFSVSEPEVVYWTAGRERGGSGMELSMRWNPHEPLAYVLDTLYFRGQALIPKIKDTETGMRLTVSAENPTRVKPDMIMDADSRKEVGNQPPLPLPTEAALPFELKADEAILVYHRKSDGERFYYKISGIKEKPGRILPSRQ